MSLFTQWIEDLIVQAACERIAYSPNLLWTNIMEYGIHLYTIQSNYQIG